jgi:hypothetical protein
MARNAVAFPSLQAFESNVIESVILHQIQAFFEIPIECIAYMQSHGASIPGLHSPGQPPVQVADQRRLVKRVNRRLGMAPVRHPILKPINSLHTILQI